MSTDNPNAVLEGPFGELIATLMAVHHAGQLGREDLDKFMAWMHSVEERLRAHTQRESAEENTNPHPKFSTITTEE